MMQSDCSDNFGADSSSNCLPRQQCIKHATFNHDKRTPGFSEEISLKNFLDIDTNISLSKKLTSWKPFPSFLIVLKKLILLKAIFKKMSFFT